jgi:hypothetical protein
MSSFKQDYIKGTFRESEINNQLNDFFKEKLIKTKSSFCPYDFIGEKSNTLYELKSRNNCYRTYQTTLIGYDKIIQGKTQVFIFDFIDGIYYINYDEEIFKSFGLKDFQRIARSDFNDKKKLYYYIPIDKLIKIN